MNINENNEKFELILEEFRKQTAKNCYKINLGENTDKILDDKIGGTPYLPVGETYPLDNDGNPLCLLLQINLKNIDLPNFPKEGILEIFTDKDLNYPTVSAFRLFKEGLEYQTNLPKIDYSNYLLQQGIKITAEKTVDYMYYSDYNFNSTLIDIVTQLYGEDAEDEDFIDNCTEYIYSNINYNNITLGGYPDYTQNDIRDEMDNSEDIICLFKIDNNADYRRLTIGDSGIMCAYIYKQDLENLELSKAFVDWDCC